MNVDQLGQQIKTKHPEYSNKSDSEVGQAVLKKYPQYQSMITHDTAGQPVEPGFLSRVGTDLVSRGKDIWSELQPPVNARQAVGAALGEKSLQVLGSVAGAATDVIGEGIKSGVQAAGNVISNIPAVQKLASTDVVGQGLQGVQNATQALGSIWNHISQKYPNVAKDLESVYNISAVLPVGEAGKSIGGEAKAVAGDLGTLISKGTQESIPKDIQAAVDSGIQKGIRPSVSGKTAPGQMAKFYTKAKDAVSAIVLNKDNLKLTDENGEVITGQLPKNLNQFSQSIEQTKKSIFDQYSAMTKDATSKDFVAGEKGVTPIQVNLSPIADELDKAANDRVLNLQDPQTASYAAQMAERLRTEGTLNPDEAETFIQHANADLQAFYKNPQYGSGTKVALDAMVVNNMRKGLDDIIESATGPGYQRLKNIYGSLKSIEKEVNHRAIVDARKSNKSLIDYSDIFTYGEIAMGIGTGNAVQAGKGLIGKGISAWYKYRNNPNNIVKNMFGDVESLLQKGEKAGQPFIPKSATGKLLMKTKDNPVGMSIKDVSGGVASESQGITKKAKVKSFTRNRNQ